MSLAFFSLLIALIGSSACLSAQESNWSVFYSKKEGPGQSRSETIFLDENGLAVVVTEAGVNYRSGKFRKKPVRLIAYDPVSRVSLVRVPLDGEQTKPVELGTSLGLSPTSQLYPSLEGEVVPSRIVSRESQYQEKPLPFELFRVHHQADQKLFPGHPFYDSAGRLVAINYRTAAEFGNGSFAFPVEVVRRIQDATVVDGVVQRSWFGVELLSSDPFAVVQGVRQDSPAAKGGIAKGDVLVQIGPRSIDSYSDAIDAFFYLREGKEVTVKFLRETELMEVKVMPELVPSAPPAPPVEDPPKEKEEEKEKAEEE